MNFEIENELRETLNKNEKLLWVGRPKKGIIVRSSDLFKIPFDMLFLGLFIFLGLTTLKDDSNDSGVTWIPIILAVVYCSIGRFLIDARLRKNTTYGITDNRVIIKSGFFSRDIKSVAIGTISALMVKEERDKSGTISFRPTGGPNSFLSGLPYWLGQKSPVALNTIAEVKTVYNLLVEQQDQTKQSKVCQQYWR
ncbi:MAG: PH domain-containing protein [Ferruginibacter sp.]